MMIELFQDSRFINQKTKGTADTYDVVICGGGLAGMALARQLKLKIKNISILVLDRFSKPLPTATFKVGESTIESGSYYLANTLALAEYLKEYHIPKLGLRFFLGDTKGLFKDRPEIGLSKFYSPSSYQIDRGLLENNLRELNSAAGIVLSENCFVQDIVLSSNEQYHEITYKQGNTKETQIVKARWVIDAMGRRRFLQKKLGLAQPNDKTNSAVWFRIDDLIDVSNFVPRTEKHWHERVPNNIRYYSTNHLVGEGYWVWIIPLSSGFTSIGIVAHEQIHPFKKYNTYEKAYRWLEKHEPALALYLQDRQPKDFNKMPYYSYSSTQTFSLTRWACVGEAGIFADPLYSVGLDLIAISNSLVTEMIRLDFDGKLSKGMLDYANVFLLKYNDHLNAAIQLSYQLLGKNPLVFSLKFLWDVLAGWGFLMPLTFNSIFVELERMAKLQHFFNDFYALETRIHKLLIDWLNKSSHKASFEFMDYLTMLPFVEELRSRNLQDNKTDSELNNDYAANLEILEELAQAIFLLALEDTMPEQLSRFTSPVWLNAWAISLDVNQWENDGLFNPRSKPRDWSRVMDPLRKHIRFSSLVQ